MCPNSRRFHATAVLCFALMTALGATSARAHGGGGGGGHGGGHAGGHFGGYQDNYGRYRYAYGGGSGYGGGPINLYPSAFAGFPEDLPAVRLHRFLTQHMPHWPWSNHRSG